MERLGIFPFDVDYTVVDGEPIVRIFGLTDKGDRRIIYDQSFEPYAYLEAAPGAVREFTAGLSFVKSITEVTKIRLGNQIKLSKVVTRLPEDVPKLRSPDFKTYETDIPFYKRYLLDKGFCAANKLELEVDGDNLSRIVTVKEGVAPIKSMAFDIETLSKQARPDSRTDPIIAISVANYAEKRCFTWLDASGENIVRVADEKELLKAFAKFVSDNGVFAIVGYNSDSFDLPFIKERSEVLGVNLSFSGFEIKSKGKIRKISEINGTVHIDILNFIRNLYAAYNLKTEVFTLNEVAHEVLGERKDEFDWDDVQKVTSDPALATKLCTYCIKDSYLTFRLYEKFKNLLFELARYTGQLIGDVSRMTTGSVVEHVLMKHAAEVNEVIPNRPSEFEVGERIRHENVGAFVFQPAPGLYHNLAVVDFRSLYPSIIISHNVCPSTIVKDSAQPKFLGRETRFGFIPSALDRVVKVRVDSKEKLKLDPKNEILNARVTVLKLITNGFYGYLGYYNSRWYCFECAGAVTALGRQYVHQVIEMAKNSGFEVVYADTDSAFVSSSDVETSSKRLVDSINSTLPSPMELELQGIYKSAIFVSTKSSERGAKKKYAMSDYADHLTIKGFQSVRRDWAAIARETQRKVLEFILINNDIQSAVSLVKDTIKELRGGAVDLDRLVIFTRLRKDISSYQQMNRHVSAASRSGVHFSSGDTIKYIISKGKPGDSISDKAVIFEIAKHSNIKYDPDYYINQQLLPSVTSIFSAVGKSTEELSEKRNNTLTGF